MRNIVTSVLSAFALVAFAYAGEVMTSAVVPAGTTSVVIDVPQHHSLRVLNFVQSSPNPSPTPVPNSRPTVVVILISSPTPSPFPTPTPTPVVTPYPTPAHAHILVSVDDAAYTPIYQAEFEESVQVQRNMRIAGPAKVKVDAMDTGAAFLTYRIERDDER